MRTPGFVRALMARWDRRVISLRPLPLVLRRTAPPAVPRRSRDQPTPLPPRWSQRVHVDLRPQIALKLLRQVSFVSRSGGDADRMFTSRIEQHTLEQLVLRDTTALASERVIERASSRSRRVELLVRSEPAVFTRAAGDAPVAPPDMVLHTFSRPPSTEASVRPPGPEIGTAPNRLVPSPGLDLAHLTDRVMSAIDGRLLTEAERMGRT